MVTVSEQYKVVGGKKVPYSSSGISMSSYYKVKHLQSGIKGSGYYDPKTGKPVMQSISEKEAAKLGYIEASEYAGMTESQRRQASGDWRYSEAAEKYIGTPIDQPTPKPDVAEKYTFDRFSPFSQANVVKDYEKGRESFPFTLRQDYFSSFLRQAEMEERVRSYSERVRAYERERAIYGERYLVSEDRPAWGSDLAYQRLEAKREALEKERRFLEGRIKSYEEMARVPFLTERYRKSIVEKAWEGTDPFTRFTLGGYEGIDLGDIDQWISIQPREAGLLKGYPVIRFGPATQKGLETLAISGKEMAVGAVAGPLDYIVTSTEAAEENRKAIAQMRGYDLPKVPGFDQKTYARGIQTIGKSAAGTLGQAIPGIALTGIKVLEWGEVLERDPLKAGTIAVGTGVAVGSYAIEKPLEFGVETATSTLVFGGMLKLGGLAGKAGTRLTRYGRQKYRSFKSKSWEKPMEVPRERLPGFKEMAERFEIPEGQYQPGYEITFKGTPKDMKPYFYEPTRTYAEFRELFTEPKFFERTFPTERFYSRATVDTQQIVLRSTLKDKLFFAEPKKFTLPKLGEKGALGVTRTIQVQKVVPSKWASGLIDDFSPIRVPLRITKIGTGTRFVPIVLPTLSEDIEVASLLKERMRIPELERIRTNIEAQALDPRPDTLRKMALEELVLSDTVPVEDTDQLISTLQAQKTVQAQQVKQVQETVTIPKPKTTTVPKPRIPEFKIPVPKIPRYFIPGTKRKLSTPKVKGVPAYRVLVRKKGKFVVVARGLPKGRATAKGISVTARTAARTFKLEPEGRTTVRDIPVPRILAKQYRRRKGKSKLPSDVYVEKTAYAIDMPGEKKEITAKGIAAIKLNSRKVL